MEPISVPVKFECKKCGCKTLQLPDDPTDDSIAKCKDCGVEFGRWGDIRKAAAKKVGEEVKKRLKKSFQDVFKGNDFIKLK